MRHDLLFSPRRIADRAAYLMPPLPNPPPCLAIQWDGKRLACYEVPTIDGVADFIEREGVLIPVSQLRQMLLPVDFEEYLGVEKYRRDYRSRKFDAAVRKSYFLWKTVAFGFHRQPGWLPGDPE